MATLTAGKLWGLRRLADDHGHFKMLAVDQRPPIKSVIASHHHGEAPWAEVGKFKSLLVEKLQSDTTAVLMDPHFAIPHGIDRLNAHKGLVVTLEDSIFTEDKQSLARMSSAIDHWSVNKIKRMGGDAVKVLTWYRPDAPKSNLQKQHDFTKAIGEACAKYDIPYLLELLVYPLAHDQEQTKEYLEMKTKRSDHVLQSIEEFTKPEYLVDIFKLESPIAGPDLNLNEAPDPSVQALFNQMASLANRPFVMLSAGANQAAFKRVMQHAYQAGASGYLAGRAIWQEALKAYPDWQSIGEQLSRDSVPYVKELNLLTDQKAHSFLSHPCYGKDGASFKPATHHFRSQYQEM